MFGWCQQLVGNWPAIGRRAGGSTTNPVGPTSTHATIPLKTAKKKIMLAPVRSQRQVRALGLQEQRPCMPGYECKFMVTPSGRKIAASLMPLPCVQQHGTVRCREGFVPISFGNWNNGSAISSPGEGARRLNRPAGSARDNSYPPRMKRSSSRIPRRPGKKTLCPDCRIPQTRHASR